VFRTSQTHPLQIPSVAVGDGLIGMTFCPGKKQWGSATGVDWDRQLDVDIAALVAWQTRVVLTFNEAWELRQLRVPDLGDALTAAGIQWHHLPIVDGGIPDATFERTWEIVSPQLHARLAAGERIVLHCKGGLGRTGTLAARLLVEGGVEPQAAIDMVRQARPGAIENDLQEDYVRRLGRAR
jgi:ADP-ribosyl-[dinitrogen reductase] hydrolase